MRIAIFLAVLSQLLWIPAARAGDPNCDPNNPDGVPCNFPSTTTICPYAYKELPDDYADELKVQPNGRALLCGCYLSQVDMSQLILGEDIPPNG